MGLTLRYDYSRGYCVLLPSAGFGRAAQVGNDDRLNTSDTSALPIPLTWYATRIIQILLTTYVYKRGEDEFVRYRREIAVALCRIHARICDGLS